MASCRTEKKNLAAVPGQKEKPLVSNGPLPQPEQLRNAPIAQVKSENSSQSGAATDSNENSVEYQLINMRELERADVFAVLITAESDKERAEACDTLTFDEGKMMLTLEQYIYGRDILDRHRKAPAIEKLVFWRLVSLRVFEQGTSSLIRHSPEEKKVYLEISANLRTMLYSALGENPEELPDYLAVRKGIDMLKAAAPRGPSPDK